MKNIQTKLLVNFLLLAFVPIMSMGVLSYKISSDALNKKVSVTTLNSLEQISKNVDNESGRMQKYFDIINTSRDLQSVLRDTDFTMPNSTMYEANKDLDSLFSSYFYKDAGIVSVVFFQEPKGVYAYKLWDTVLEEEWRKSVWYKKTVEQNGKINWIGSIPNPDTGSNVKYVYIAGCLIKDTKNVRDFKSLGVIFIMLDENIFGNIYRDVNVNQFGSIMITDKNGRIVSYSDKNMLSTDVSSYSYMDAVLRGEHGYFKTMVGRQRVVIAYYTSPKTGFKIVEVIPYLKFVKEIYGIRYLTVYLGILCFAALCVTSYFISKNIASPIQDLRAAMRKVEEGYFNVEVRSRSEDELGQMAKSFNFMVTRIGELFQKAVNEERVKKEFEIRSLQYQINPHFLYNILGSIRLTAMMNGDQAVAHMLQVLSRLLSRTIGKAGVFISIAAEMENVQDFIYIQQIRYNDKIRVRFDIDEEILNYEIPNLLLQPLVENAIFHGIDQKKDDALIEISGKQLNGDIVFKVRDNGIGMTEEQVKTVLSVVSNFNKGSFTHIGVKNVDDRIKLNFGTNYGIRIHSIPGDGTIVTVILPIIKEGGKLSDDEYSSGRR